jgi:hypothetical protein
LNLSVVDVNDIFESNWSRILDGTSQPQDHSNQDPYLKMWKESKPYRNKKGSRAYNSMLPNLDTQMMGPYGYPNFYPNSPSYFPYPQSRMDPSFQQEQQAMMAFQHQYSMQLLENMHFYQGRMDHAGANQMYAGSPSRGRNNATPVDQYPGRFPDYSVHRGLEYPSHTTGYDYNNPSAISPTGRIGSSNVSFSESDDYSIRQQESPMMNPNAQVFSTNYAIPSK